MPSKYDKPINPMLLTDFYKICHKGFYNKGITQLISYWTPRKSRIKGIEHVVFFGLQAYIKKYLIDYFNVHFFDKPWEENEKTYIEVIGASLDKDIAEYEAAEFKKLWQLGYLPIEISSLQEGTLVPIGCPTIQFKCTKADFFWLAEYLETLSSCNIWFPMTDATIAYVSRKILDKYYDLTAEDYIPRASGAGNFSMRGMSSVESAPMGDAGHLLSFTSTATVPTLWWLHCFYNTDFSCAKGTPSTEHSVMESYTPENEFEAYRRLIEDIRPNGNLSMVSDTWDIWKVMTDYLPKLKNSIMKRDGKIIIRPDSGNPADILCGKKMNVFDTDESGLHSLLIKKAMCEQDGLKDKIAYTGRMEDKFIEAEVVFLQDKKSCNYKNIDKVNIKTRALTPEEKGIVELMWDVLGGNINSKGYRVIDPHGGVIYGDAITHEREIEIFERLMAKKYAANNVILGFGSYTYQYVTRDTFGFALKVTSGVIDGREVALFKDPITDKGPNGAGKKSQKGMCIVFHDKSGNITYTDGHNEKETLTRKDNLLRPVFRDSNLLVDEHFDEIRLRLHANF